MREFADAVRPFAIDVKIDHAQQSGFYCLRSDGTTPNLTLFSVWMDADDGGCVSCRYAERRRCWAADLNRGKVFFPIASRQLLCVSVLGMWP